MDYDKLIERMKCQHTHRCQMYYEYPSCKACQRSIQQEADLAIETLRAENIEMQTQLNEFSEFLCRMTGGLLSKTNYTAQAMISAAEDYQQRVCDNDCGLRADLARVTAERDTVEQNFLEFTKQWWEEANGFPCRFCKFENSGGCEQKAKHPDDEKPCAGRWFEWRGIKED